MAKLGSPQSNEFSIGTAEVRVGPLTEALKLPQSRSIGLVDNATISFNVTSVDLKGLFPQVIVDTAVTEQTGSLKVTAREFSRRNLNLILGNPVSTAALTEASTTLVATADVAANAVTFSVVSATNFAADDIIVIYPDGRPEDVTVTQIASISTNTLTLKTGLGTLVAYPALTESGTSFKVFKAFGVAAGAVTRTNYFSVALLKQKNASGRPVMWQVWKAANAGSTEESNSPTDYASLNLDFKILQPSAADTGVGGGLNHVAAIVNAFPSAARFGGIDQ
jgi:hypothetical protein